MNRAIRITSFFVIASGAATAQTAGTASFTGSVVGDSGRPVPGAKLVYTRMPTYTRDKLGHLTTKEPGLTNSVAVGSDGTFALTALPAGSYFVCGYGSQASQVSGCNWDGGHTVDLADGQAVRNVVRAVHEGTTITIRVSDPNARILLPDVKGNVTKERRFFVGVTAPSGYGEPAKVVSAAAGQFVFQVAIPNRQKVRFLIDTELGVSFAGSDLPSNNIPVGASVETRQPTTLQIDPGGRNAITVDFAVK
jgi:hypothetical protein